MTSLKIAELTLNDGVKIPCLGFGTYKLNGSAGARSIANAIDMGYRLIDSAFNYENEGTVGRAVKSCSVPRDRLFITSKLPGRHQAYQEAVTTIEESLYRADLDYYDLYLIHWPNPRVNLYVEAWQALIDAKKRGLIRSIGVCNFLPEHLDRLTKETGVTPSVNQVELHPYFNQEAQRAYHTQHHIVTECWSPLFRGKALLENAVIRTIAQAHGKTESQIVLRWHIQLGAIPIPKASSAQHQAENADVFDFSLTEEEMKAICALTRPDGRMKNQDPNIYEEF